MKWNNINELRGLSCRAHNVLIHSIYCNKDEILNALLKTGFAAIYKMKGCGRGVAQEILNWLDVRCLIKTKVCFYDHVQDMDYQIIEK